jgi:ribA/ribD-fused uncharacterized protein
MSSDPILFYRERDEYGYFSNFYKAQINVDGKSFFCNEQYIMYSKAMLFGDSETANLILACKSQPGIKALGRQVKNFKEDQWVANRENIADQCNLAKFSQHLNLQKLLLETGQAYLAEAAQYDSIWGIGCNPEVGQDRSKWNGLNILGVSLMRIRDQLRIKSTPTA